VTQPFAEPSSWQLEVTEADNPTPRMRRILLTNPQLPAFTYLPGQDVSLAFQRSDGLTVRRRYTIRRFDPEQRWLEINVVMHGDGPGMRWAASAKPGTRIEALAPRGKITLAQGVDWHLFAGDSSAVPATLAMIEALNNRLPAFAFLEVDDPAERQPLDQGGTRTIAWRYGTGDGSTPQGLVSALREATLPNGRGHAYLAGEVGLVLGLKAVLLARGWPNDQISAKAYWNRGKPNAERGEPEQRAS
jgi:NADPH-dependent ferric siderophore reductase